MNPDIGFRETGQGRCMLFSQKSGEIIPKVCKHPIEPDDVTFISAMDDIESCRIMIYI